MISLVIIWSLLIIITFQVGATVLDLIGSTSFKRIGDRFALSVWLGVIVLSNLLLALSVFTRLSLLTVSFLSVALVLASFVLGRRSHLAELEPRITPGLVLGFLALLVGISFVTTQVVTWYDTGGYHFGIVKWLSRHGTVPGLALIYYGFGYTSSWFALGAAFNDWILDARASTLTGGFAFLMLIVLFWICLVRVLANRARVQDWFIVISSLLSLVVITRYEIYISPSQDLPVIILTIVTAWAMIILSGHGRENREQTSHVDSNEKLLPALLAAGAVSVKLTALPLLFVSGLFYLFTQKSTVTRVLSLFSTVLLILTPFLAVQAITSGCLLYPSSMFCLDLPWTIGSEKIQAVIDQIRKAAQWSTITPPGGNSWGWLFQWSVAEKFQTVLILLAVLSTAFSIRRLRIPRLHWTRWPLALGILGFLYTLVIGPTWRYSLGYLALITGLTIGLYCVEADSAPQRVLAYLEGGILKKLAPVAVLFILSAAVPILSIMVNNTQALNFLRMEIRDAINRGELTAYDNNWSRLIVPPRIVNFHLGVKNSEKISFTISSLKLVEKKAEDFTFYKPESGFQCWDAELPCSQFLTYEKVRLRAPEKGLSGGFVRVN